MALIACPECGQNISSEATSCPHCGLPLDPNRAKIDYVTGEQIPITPRPGVRMAAPLRRYPTTTGMVLMAVGSALVMLGSFMPWVRLGPISVSGMQGDGRITVVVGLVMLILAVTMRTTQSRGPRILVTLGAFASIAIAAIDNTRLREGLPDNLIGAGIGTVFIGGIVALIGTFLREQVKPYDELTERGKVRRMHLDAAEFVPRAVDRIRRVL